MIMSKLEHISLPSRKVKWKKMLVLLKRNSVKMTVLFLFQAGYKYFRVWSKRPGNRKFVQWKMVILARHCPLTGRYFQPYQQGKWNRLLLVTAPWKWSTRKLCSFGHYTLFQCNNYLLYTCIIIVWMYFFWISVDKLNLNLKVGGMLIQVVAWGKSLAPLGP